MACNDMCKHGVYKSKLECNGKPKVTFVCNHNSCRSQIAEALGKSLDSDVFDSYSAGTIIKNQIHLKVHIFIDCSKCNTFHIRIDFCIVFYIINKGLEPYFKTFKKMKKEIY